MPVLYFHGGAYVFGSPESMIDAANAYNARGYRFCSVGFQEAPWHKFPSMIDDGFLGVKTALAYMERAGIPCDRIAIGGTSAGGHLATLMCYAAWLQEAFRFPAERIAACISIAGVADAADMLVKPFPTHRAWRALVDLPTDATNRRARRSAVACYSPIDLVAYEARNGGVPHVPLFVAHGRKDTLSPYASQERLVELLREANGHDSVRFITLEGQRWQHMNTTVTMHKSAVQENPVLTELFEWLESLGAIDGETLPDSRLANVEIPADPSPDALSPLSARATGCSHTSTHSSSSSKSAYILYRAFTTICPVRSC